MGNLGFQELLLLFIVIGLFLIPLILFLINLQNTLKAIDPQNRTMEPGKVWLMLIPLFNVIWIFMVVSAIANSTQAQLEQYGVSSSQKPTYNLGLAWAICTLCNWIPMVGVFAGIVSFVLFILYWVKVNEVRKQLVMLGQLHQNKEEGSIL